MLETIHHALRTQPALPMLLFIGLGCLIGAIRIGSFSLGPEAGVDVPRRGGHRAGTSPAGWCG
jgi:hypothetical protein